MADIFDVAEWFLSRASMTPKKLQKLCYYYKAWGLALYNRDLLTGNEFQAWVHGPVNPELYQKYKEYGWQDIPQGADNSAKFGPKELDLLESIWLTYGDMSANALEAQTHSEAPWKNARIGLGEFDNCENPISTEDMRAFYMAVYSQNQGE